MREKKRIKEGEGNQPRLHEAPRAQEETPRLSVAGKAHAGVRARSNLLPAPTATGNTGSPGQGGSWGLDRRVPGALGRDRSV